MADDDAHNDASLFAVIVPELLMPPSKVVAATRAMPVPSTVIVPALVMPPMKAPTGLTPLPNTAKPTTMPLPLAC